ncbi:MAG TPA: hypothetical protein VEG42_05435 [Thermoplasmata archaeon]|nr:hypothetical protein [Thermoplasmata archaeon]
MSPRKSSTSSGKPSVRRRPRYLGIEVAGELFPPLSPRAWEGLLAERWTAAPASPTPPFRLIRAEGRRAIVEVDHLFAAEARAAWAARPTEAGRPTLVPHRTWGTLVGAKAWLRSRA